MARHHSYSKRSRESRKAMGDGAGDQPKYPDDGAAEQWQVPDDDPTLPPNPVS